MATTTLGATYSPPSSLDLHYSDNFSSLHPDRPIRPLPKRRLRSRLSPDVADSILYSSDSGSSKPLFQFPYNEQSRLPNGTSVHEDHYVNEMEAIEDDVDVGKDSYKFTGNDFGSDEEVFVMRRRQEQRQRPASIINTPSRNVHPLARNDASKFIKPSIPHSTASSNESVDGYDSFENTNNNKKRKIPTSGSLGSHQSSLSADMAHMALSSTQDIDAGQVEADSGVGHYYGSGSSAIPAVSSGNGISGAGRGRFGRIGTRHHSGRSPLGVSVNGSNAPHNNRSLYHRRDYGASSSPSMKEPSLPQTPDQGIISAAIANAAALPATPLRGQENASLFERQSSKKPGSAKTQFTFTCESDSAKSMVWPEESPSSRWDNDSTYNPRVRSVQNGKGVATQGTQTSPNIVGQQGQDAHQPQAVNHQAPQQTKKPRRPLAKQYAVAARERRLRQEYSNYHHPPKVEDVWICQFCEYESIFGQPPQYLTRQYEAKDRRERKRLAEKRRLLEKAKMKGRKGKKGNKNANKAAQQQQQQQNQKQRYDEQSAEDVPMQNQGTQSEQYLYDDCDEETVPTPILPPQTPSKIPQPIMQNQSHSLRPSSGSGAVRQGAGGVRDPYF